MSQENEFDKVRPYVADGIEEYDNPLPSWWTWLFILTIFFGIAYMIDLHLFAWDLLDEELKNEQLAYEAQQKALLQSTQGPGESVEKRMKDSELIEQGKMVFQGNCAACHGASGEGLVGPNLTDPYWIHGGAANDIIQTIAKGVPEKGMIAWSSILGPKKIEAAAAYVMSLSGSHPANAKGPQGVEFKP